MAKLVLVSTLSHKLGKKITIKDIDTVMIVYIAADLFFRGKLNKKIVSIKNFVLIMAYFKL